MLSRNILRSVHEEARDQARQACRDVAVRSVAERAEEGRDTIRASQDHDTFRANASTRLTGARDEFHLAAIAQNLRRMARLTAAVPA